MTRTVFPATDFSAVPYPGERPAFSFVQLDGIGHCLHHDGAGWLLAADDTPLTDWLRQHEATPLEHRRSVLAYGSNACPAKIRWLQHELGLDGPVIVMQVTVRGLAAVWAAGRRVVDDQRPATLAAMPGVAERHAVWLADADQLAVLDRCEGRGDRYDLARVHTGTVTLDSGEIVADPLAYVARAELRLPLLVDGLPVRCIDLPQAEAQRLDGAPATTDGLQRTVLTTAEIPPLLDSPERGGD